MFSLARRQLARCFSTEAQATGRKLACQADSLLAIGTRDIYDSDHDMFRVRVFPV